MGLIGAPLQPDCAAPGPCCNPYPTRHRRERRNVPDAPRILLLNGPNLNVLGRREPDIYGRQTLAEIEAACHKRAKELGITVEMRQSNHEGELVDWIQQAVGRFAGIVINPAAFTHTSLAIADALKFAGLPVIELHLSNIFKREAFRHQSFVSPVAHGMICGFGGSGYLLAIEAMAGLLGREKVA